MSDQSRIDDALNKFEAAMRTFEGALVQARQKNAVEGNAQAEASALLEDRSRIAAELDRTKAQLSDMNISVNEAETRIASAMQTIKSILER